MQHIIKDSLFRTINISSDILYKDWSYQHKLYNNIDSTILVSKYDLVNGSTISIFIEDKNISEWLWRLGVGNNKIWSLTRTNLVKVTSNNDPSIIGVLNLNKEYANQKDFSVNLDLFYQEINDDYKTIIKKEKENILRKILKEHLNTYGEDISSIQIDKDFEEKNYEEECEDIVNKIK